MTSLYKPDIFSKMIDLMPPLVQDRYDADVPDLGAAFARIFSQA